MEESKTAATSSETSQLDEFGCASSVPEQTSADGGAKTVHKQDSALLSNIKTKGQNSVRLDSQFSHINFQYYYAHAPKNYTTEGAEVFKGAGLIYGGDPVKLGEREKGTVEVQKKERPAKKIAKYSWLDEDAKVK